MRKLLYVLILLTISAPVYAATYAYFGIYGDSTLEAYPGAALNEDYAKYRSGLHFDKTFELDAGISLTPFIENEILMDGGNVTFYNPASSNFVVGAKVSVYAIDIIFQHECRHAFELRSKQQEQYNLVEFRWRIAD